MIVVRLLIVGYISKNSISFFVCRFYYIANKNCFKNGSPGISPVTAAKCRHAAENFSFRHSEMPGMAQRISPLTAAKCRA